MVIRPDPPHYLGLRGAVTNAGDHLIGDRAAALFARIRPDRQLSLRDRRIPLDPDDPEVANAAAIVLLGGPAWQRSTFPGVYPLVPDLDRIKPPIVPLGLGWRGEESAQAADFTFDEQTVQLLRRIERDGLWGSARDTTTLALLSSQGMTRQLMSGCPSWYDQERLGSRPSVPEGVRSIAYSVGARSSIDDAFGEFEHSLVSALTARYPDASLKAVFHHPITPTPGYPEGRSDRHRHLADALRRDGVNIVEIAGSSELLIEAYSDSDLHIGLRVHAHLARCSRRQPSLLLAEDARAHVMCWSLGHVAFEAVDRRTHHRPTPNRRVWSEVERYLDSCESEGWPQLVSVAGIIDGTYPVMRWLISALP